MRAWASRNVKRSRLHPTRRYGSLPTDEIVRHIRDHAHLRRTAAVLDTRNSLFDLCVHSQDICRPLGHEFVVPPAHSVAGLERVLTMGWPFHAERRFAGQTLRATDADWTWGAGPELAAPALDLLLLATGRSVADLPGGRERGDARSGSPRD